MNKLFILIILFSTFSFAQKSEVQIYPPVTKLMTSNASDYVITYEGRTQKSLDILTSLRHEERLLDLISGSSLLTEVYANSHELFIDKSFRFDKALRRLAELFGSHKVIPEILMTKESSSDVHFSFEFFGNNPCFEEYFKDGKSLLSFEVQCHSALACEVNLRQKLKLFYLNHKDKCEEQMTTTTPSGGNI